MDAVRLDHVNLSVRDLGESVAWYGRVFGFAPVEEGVGDGTPWAILRSGEGRGDALLCLYHHPEYAFVDPEEADARGLHGVRHVGFRIADERAWRATVARENLEAEELRYPHSTSWYLTDPTGYWIEVALWDGDRVAFDAARAAKGAR